MHRHRSLARERDSARNKAIGGYLAPHLPNHRSARLVCHALTKERTHQGFPSSGSQGLLEFFLGHFFCSRRQCKLVTVPRDSHSIKIYNGVPWMSGKVEQFNGLTIKSDYLAFTAFRKNRNVVLAAIKRCIACTAAY